MTAPLGRPAGKPSGKPAGNKPAGNSAGKPIASREAVSALLMQGLTALGVPERGDAGNQSIAGIRGRVELVPLLDRYMDELELFNAAFDLVGADNRRDLAVRHLLDSLAPWKPLLAAMGLTDAAGGQTLADAGTGAGLPGIPLALLFPGFRVTLIERMTKRCSFLENCRALLGLTNVEILEADITAAPAGRFDAVVFRAFRPLDPAMYQAIASLARPGGVLAAWKGRRSKIDEEMAGLEALKPRWEAYPVSVPFLESDERHLVTIAP